MSPRRVKAYTYILLATIAWGIAGPVIKFTLRGIDPLPFLVYRFWISAAIALVLLAINRKSIPKHPMDLGLVTISAILGYTISLGLLFLGLQNSTVIELSFITIIGPLLTAVAGAFFLHEHVPRKEKLGLAIASGGTALAVFAPFIANGNNLLELSGNFLIILSMLAAIAATLITKILLRRKVNPMGIVNISFVISAIALTPLLLSSYTPTQFVSLIKALPLQYHLGVWYMAIVSGTIAYYWSNKGLKTIEVGESSIFGYLTPIISAPLAIIFLGETLRPIFIIGAILVFIGVFKAEYKSYKKT